MGNPPCTSVYRHVDFWSDFQSTSYMQCINKRLWAIFITKT